MANKGHKRGTMKLCRRDPGFSDHPAVLHGAGNGERKKRLSKRSPLRSLGAGIAPNRLAVR